MANREDSIHIRIKIDVDIEDKQFLENLSSQMARADEQKLLQKETPTQQRTTDETPKKEIQREVRTENEKTQKEIDDLEKEIKTIKDRIKKGIDSKDPKVIKERLEAKKDRLLLQEFKSGPVGKLQNFTSEQFSNLRQAATNPGQFILGAFTKKLGKYGGMAAKGGIYAMIALLVYETILFVIDQLMQPGRWLDRRFKRLARLETMNFYERTLQEEIRHGYQEIRVTTMEGLRGGASQVNGNFFEFSSGATGLLQSSPYRSSQEVYKSQNAAGSITDTQGNPRRRTMSGRFG